MTGDPRIKSGVDEKAKVFPNRGDRHWGRIPLKRSSSAPKGRARWRWFLPAEARAQQALLDGQGVVFVGFRRAERVVDAACEGKGRGQPGLVLITCARRTAEVWPLGDTPATAKRSTATRIGGLPPTRQARPASAPRGPSSQITASASPARSSSTVPAPMQRRTPRSTSRASRTQQTPRP